MPTLDVELNGEAVHDIDAPDSFVTDGPFRGGSSSTTRVVTPSRNTTKTTRPTTSSGPTRLARICTSPRFGNWTPSCLK
ncbi:hypothetical protein [Halorubrum sp. SP9]|uniref:hypothetical protein n=1 Tax=Halorubrum sp. SP9 TaxID=1537267 RepID=UPI0018EEAA59|nr:hypothetical protein [Halorubrum sp. SP9]